MSVEHPNLWNSNKMHQTSENCTKYYGTGEVVDTKIRKFFFLLQDKQIERDLRVTISVRAGDRIGDQNILVELTNDVNPVFLFSLSITKTDFDVLKNDQGLNVEFEKFPKALVNLLDQCKDNVSENGGRFKLMLIDYCGTAAGCCIMDMSKIQIKIIEECAFKNICHLTLDIMRGTELQIRHKLEAEVCTIKQALLKKSKFHDEALIKISDLVGQINEKNDIIEKSNGVINDLMVQKEEESCKLRSQAENQEKLIREDCNRKIAEERKHFEKSSCQMLSKIENLEKELRLFHEKELEMQNLFHEKERDRELIEVELISKKQEINQLRNQNEKLDTDYHDKDKTVNILRTRLAVAEQELKDNSALLLNHQNKLDEALQEKNNFQTNLDFLQNKLDKKDTTLKSLSDELIKANDIIAKQQSKLTMFSSKINECELVCSKLEGSLKGKEDELRRQIKVINKLEEDLVVSAKECTDLREKSERLEKNVTVLDDKVKSKSEVVAALRENFEDLIAEFQLDTPQKSLLAYRAFLSMPTLLPSDNYRHTDDLWDFVLEDHPVSKNRSTDIDPNAKISKLSNIIKPYIIRFLRRFQSIPLSLFKSLHTPLTVLIAPSGPQSRHLLKSQSNENINQATEYAIYNKATEHYLPTIQSESTLNKNNPNCIDYNKNRNVVYDNTKNLKCVRTESNGSDRNFGLGEGSSKPPHYAHVGAFRLRPCERFQRMEEPADHKNAKCIKGQGSIRRTPAVSAPPLTPEQRHAVDSVFKAGRSRRTHNPTQVNWDLPQYQPLHPTVLKKLSDENNLLIRASQLNKVATTHEANQLGDFKSVSEISVHSNSKTTQKSLEDSGSLPNIRRNEVAISKQLVNRFDNKPRYIASEAFDVSVDLPEPSAYFAV